MHGWPFCGAAIKMSSFVSDTATERWLAFVSASLTDDLVIYL
jgi:hypothetical protein